MIIDEKIKQELLTFNNDEDTYMQFEQKIAIINRITGLDINPADYKLQYELHEASIIDYMELQKELYETIHREHPEVEFGESGRLKSPYSHYEKIIRKFIDLIEKDEIRPVEILDVYAMKVFVSSIIYPIDKLSIDSEGIYIDSGADEFRIGNDENAKDAFAFNYNGRTLNILVEADCSNVWIDNGIPYISTTLNDEEIVLPLNTAMNYKRSNKEDLIPYCYEVQKTIEAFFNSKGFVTRKRKDYLARAKKSGYSALQASYYSEEENLGVECQIRNF